MNRRSFFNKLSAAVAGCYLAVGVELKTVANEVKAVVNTAWITARYEVCFLNSLNSFSQMVFPKEITQIPDKSIEGPEYILVCDPYHPGFETNITMSEFLEETKTLKAFKELQNILG